MLVKKMVKKVVGRERRKRSHCRRGHEFDEKNTHVGTSGYRYCRACAVINQKIWEERHPKYHSNWARKRQYYHSPWAKHYKLAKVRSRKIKSYIERGFDLTKEDVKNVWFRDKAYLMKRPSIDRIKNAIGYYPNNIQFLEFIDNCRKGRN